MFAESRLFVHMHALLHIYIYICTHVHNSRGMFHFYQLFRIGSFALQHSSAHSKPRNMQGHRQRSHSPSVPLSIIIFEIKLFCVIMEPTLQPLHQYIYIRLIYTNTHYSYSICIWRNYRGTICHMRSITLGTFAYSIIEFSYGSKIRGTLVYDWDTKHMNVEINGVGDKGIKLKCNCFVHTKLDED